MARIRSIHPGIWTDEAFVSVSAAARLLFIGILNESDDQGAFEWKPVQLKMRVLPADNVDTKALLAELADVELVKPYQVDGTSYGAVRHFRQWQNPKKPNSLYPMPDEFRTFAGPKSRKFRTSSEPDDDDSGGSSEPAFSDTEPVPIETEPLAAKPASVPNQFRTSPEKLPQMEDGGEKEEEEEVVPFATLTPSARAEAACDPPDFQRFWLAYPRKVGKGAARKAFAKAAAKADLDVILHAIARTRWHADPQFIPHPATWLGQERWLDEQPSQIDPVLAAAGVQPDEFDFPAMRMIQ